MKPSSAPPAANHPRGFTLVEVAIAIGIVSFALLSCVGLNAVSLTSFSDARTVDVSSRIFRTVLNQAQISDFSSVPTPIRYFDAEGFEVTASKAIYRSEVQTVGCAVEDFALKSSNAQNLIVDIYRVKANGPSPRVARRSAIIGNRTKGD